ncbi:MAG: aldose epimerase [Actinomycetota bacterium]
MSQLSLESGPASTIVDTKAGGRLSALLVDDLPLLFTAPSVSVQWGSYPMVPWAGRVADGRFGFAGATHQLPLNMAPHAIHGVGFTSPWTVVDEATGSAGRARVATIALDLPEPWPFGGRAVQRFELTGEALTIELAVTAEVDMPVMLGWHPWFNRHLGMADGSTVEAELTFLARSMYELDDRAIPTGRLVEPTPRPWDNCFTDVEQGPVLRWPGLVDLTLTSSCDHWVVFDRPGHAVCVEPQSAAPDVFNRAPEAGGPPTLAGGETARAWFRLAWG